MNLENSQHKYLNFLIILVLGYVGFAYYPILEFDFLLNFDDDMLIVNAPELKSASWENVKLIFSSFKEGLYHPLTSIAWMLQIDLFGADSYYFHFTNLVMHLLNTLLVFLFARSFSNKVIVGLMAALMFGIHPMHIENVAWASSQKDLFATFFFLLSLWSYSASLNKKNNMLTLLSFLFALLAMLSKASAIVIPFVMVLMDWFKGGINWKRSFITKTPFFLLTLVFGVVNYLAQKEYGYISEFSEDLGWMDRISFVFYSAFYYLQKFVAPLELAPKNLYPETSEMVPMIYYLSILIIGALIFLLIKLHKSLKWLLFGLLFYIIVIAPTLKLIPTGNDIVSNRYAYMAYIGLYIAIASYISQLKVLPRVLVFVVVLTLWQREAYAYTPVFENSFKLWTRVIEQHEDRNWGLAMAYNERGQVAYKEGNYTQAKSDINKALSIDADMMRALLNRANILDKEGNYEAALKDLNKLLKVNPDNVFAIKIRSSIYGKMNKTKEALEDVEKALTLDPNNPELYNNLGILNSIEGNYEQAVSSFKKAIEIQPLYLQARMNLGKLLLDRNRAEEALDQLARVYQEDPDLFFNAYLISKAYLKMNEPTKAEKILKKFAEDENQASQIANSFARDSLFETSIVYYTIAMGEPDIRSKSLYQRAQAYKKLGENQNALDDLLALIEVVPNAIFFYEIGELYEGFNDLQNACKFYREAEKRNSEEAPAKIKELCGAYPEE